MWGLSYSFAVLLPGRLYLLGISQKVLDGLVLPYVVSLASANNDTYVAAFLDGIGR